MLCSLLHHLPWFLKLPFLLRVLSVGCRATQKHRTCLTVLLSARGLQSSLASRHVSSGWPWLLSLGHPRCASQGSLLQPFLSELALRVTDTHSCVSPLASRRSSVRCFPSPVRSVSVQTAFQHYAWSILINKLITSKVYICELASPRTVVNTCWSRQFSDTGFQSSPLLYPALQP